MWPCSSTTPPLTLVPPMSMPMVSDKSVLRSLVRALRFRRRARWPVGPSRLSGLSESGEYAADRLGDGTHHPRDPLGVGAAVAPHGRDQPAQRAELALQRVGGD